MSEATDLVARWLRQRRELGESELVLESAAALELEGAAAEPATKSAPPPPEILTPIERAAGATAPGATELEIVRIGDLAALRETALGCPRCRLSETRTHVVFGEGSPTAEVVVVGEAPGAEEDRTGRPFVGRAGKLLDLMLASIGFPRDSVFICNVLKCRPPGNRNPQADEVAACSPYLIRQLELVRPRAIFAVGTFAAQALLDTKVPIGQLRGTVHSYQDIPLVPTYHPAALLRNPAWVRPAWEDLQRLRAVVDPL
jgi:uracil-DNA glycosylase